MVISAAPFEISCRRCTHMSPVPYCVYFCSRAELDVGLGSWLGCSRLGLRYVEPFHYKLLPWSWLKRHWLAEYWISMVQWTAIIDAGADPWTPATHSPPTARRTSCATLSSVYLLSLVIQHGIFRTGNFFSTVRLIDKPHPLFRSPKSGKNCAAYSRDFR